MEKLEYELIPQNGRKSFNKKAIVKHFKIDNNERIELYSYGILVAYKDIFGNFWEITSPKDVRTQTTSTHIKSFKKLLNIL